MCLHAIKREIGNPCHATGSFRLKKKAVQTLPSVPTGYPPERTAIERANFDSRYCSSLKIRRALTVMTVPAVRKIARAAFRSSSNTIFRFVVRAKIVPS
jgi:hypothetical protein